MTRSFTASLFSRRALIPRLIAAAVALAAASVHGQITIVQNGQPQAVIMLKPSPQGYLQLAAMELQDHVQRITGALLPIATVGSESSHPGKIFIYIGASTATAAAGVSTSGMTIEHYVIRTIGGNLCIVGRDAGQDDWTDLSDCQPGTLFGVYHFLQDVIGVRWVWPGESGVFTPITATLTAPALNVAFGPAMSQRKYRTPRIGLYLGGGTTYGFGVPVLPTSSTAKAALANDELRWLRRMRMGTRKSPSFAHSFTTWWSTHGATHPEYFAELLPGRTQPHPAADRVKLHVNSAAVWQQRVDDWVAAGAGTNLNICPNDSRSHCVCSACLSWDRPAQSPETVFDGSDARLGDRYARFYTEIANRVKLINPNTTVYGYAYDTYRNAPLEATVPDNVALAYIPGAPSDATLDGIAETEADVLGWIAQGCAQMYLRPNWMLSAHAGPFWPTRRLGEHFKRLTESGNIRGFDSDSSCSSYSGFGFYYYLVCRLIADPSLEVNAIIDEYCSAFGSAAPRVRDYLAFWENFAYNQADSGNSGILGWNSCMAAYPGSYTDRAFDGAELILAAAYASLQPDETAARARLDFLKTACVHGRLTAQAIALVSPTLALADNPEAARAMRSLLACRNQHADSHALWREWMIDRESAVPNMQSYWSSVLATPEVGNGTNAGAFIETGGQVAMEAEHFTSSSAGAGTAAGITWQEISGVAGASGSVMQALPNSGIATDTQTNGPRLDFKVDFHTTGAYYIFLHMPHHASGQDDSVNVGLDGTLVQANLGNTSGSWRWRTTNPITGLVITTPGARTFNVWMREDGVMVDKIILTTNASFSLPGTDLGPAESGKRGSTERLLTVGNGTGDGWYGEASLISIAANAAPPSYVFDHWTGDTSFLANANADSTFALIPAQDMRVTAAYKLNPALDTDSDGMADAWEIASFGNITTASAASSSDFDQDGLSDLAEYLAGTAPADAASRFGISHIGVDTDGSVTVRWPGTVGKTYTLEASADLQPGSWLPVAVGIPGSAPDCVFTVHFRAPASFLRVVLE